MSIRITAREHALRREFLVAHAREQGLRGIVLFDSAYILYYAGFAFIPTERPIALVLSADGETALVVPRLEVEHARAESAIERIDHYDEYPGNPRAETVLARTLSELGIAGRIGADQDGYPWILGYRGPSLSQLAGGEVYRISAAVEGQMAIKSDAEIALIRESIRWGNLAHTLLQRFTSAGATETEVSARASRAATEAMLAAIGPIYRTAHPFLDGAHAGYRGQIGRAAAIPHALANNVVFQAGDVLVTGATAPVWGYVSELERTMVVGEPSGEQARLFGHMKAAQEVAFDAIRPGLRCGDVDLAVRGYYEQHELMPFWRHHTGHAIGLRYHEGPFLDSGDETEIEPGMVFTVEPGLYAAELGGFRHSDTVVVTEGGNELLTYYPRDLEALVVAP
ncbi:MAG: Xaa-Pro peptidase family protein [Actinomycetota bacterium]|nr:Xaa-Pro peptidase family protein [Actinomycetota bacterium]